MDETEKLEEELKELKEKNKFLTNYLEGMKELSEDQIKDGVLYTNKIVDLKNEKYKDVKSVFLKGLYLEVLEYYLSKNIDITIEIPSGIELKEKEYLYKNEDKLNRVTFEANNELYLKISDLKKLDETMDLMVKDIKESNLSPYEKYIAAYDIVKSYKTYKASNDKNASRSVYAVILNDYAVCLGYDNFLNELLKRLSIESDEIHCICKGSLHSVVLTHIKDSKYNIDSFQISDPTADAIKEDYKQKPLVQNYMFLNVTFKEAMNYYTNIESSKIFNETSPEKIFEYLKHKFGKKYIEITCNTYIGDLYNILKTIGVTDDRPINVFNDLFKKIGTDETKYTLETAEKAISYIQRRINQKIDYQQQLKAIYNVNKFINQDNKSYYDFVKENFRIEKILGQIDTSQYEDMKEIIKETKIQNVTLFFKEFYNRFYSPDFIKEALNNKDVLTNILIILIMEKQLEEQGIIFNGNKLLINKELQENDIIKYDNELNNYYIEMTPEINNMSIKEINEYINKLINNKRF